MTVLRLLLLVLLLGAVPVSADPVGEFLTRERARPATGPIARERFVEQPRIGTASLSPDGRWVAFTRIAASGGSVWLRSTGPGSAPRRVLSRAGNAGLSWSRDSHWLFLVDAESVRALSIANEPGSGRLAKLGGRFKAHFLGVDPTRSAVLMLDTAKGEWRLWRVAPGASPTLIAHAGQQIVDAVIGPDGRVAFAKLTDGDRHVLVTVDAGKPRVIATCANMRRCDLIATTADGRAAWIATDLGGDRRSLARIDRSGHLTMASEDPRHVADLKQVISDRQTGTPAIAQYASNGPSLVGLDAAARSGLARLHMPGIISVETSPRYWLVAQEDGRMQGRCWFLFDPRTGARKLILDSQPQRLDPDQLASTVPFTFPASDGFRVHGLLTVPPGRDLSRAPILTLVHGGPWAHDEPGYSGLVQLLANRGVIVFQPQFRGSTGFGRSYLFAANGDFGDGRVQRDIEEGTRWLITRGIGNARQAAIMGASFGGYSTLQALSNGSHLYSVGIAVVPPTDFGWIIHWAARRTDLGEAEGVRFSAVQRFLGMNPDDPEVARRLSAQSPRARVGQMRTPLLLIAAGRDERVPIRSVIDYAARLKAAKAPARIIVATKLHHSNRDVNGSKATMYMFEDMLARRWGWKPVERPSPAVRQWMSANLRSF